MIYDIFNGDADGICALHQLRLSHPAESTLVTGVKRDIALLKEISPQPGDSLTVLDIAVEKNLAPLLSMLEMGIQVCWFDHHNPGELPRHPNFHDTIDTSADVCTSLLVDRHLQGAHRRWAIAAAFGDNLHAAARCAAEPLSLSTAQLDALRELGECINYNGYGDSLEDLHFHPADVYRAVQPFDDPFDFMAEAPEFHALREGYLADTSRARSVQPWEARPSAAVFILPDAAWARRVSGVFANNLASANPDCAHAVLTLSPKGYYVVSVRAPLTNPTGADELCGRFETGGGRKAAAGINVLPETEISQFTAAFIATYHG